jgi:hypothetical protein
MGILASRLKDLEEKNCKRRKFTFSVVMPRLLQQQAPKGLEQGWKVQGLNGLISHIGLINKKSFPF